MTLINITAHLENLLVTAKPPMFLDVGVSQAYLPWEQRLDVLLNTPQATANQLEALIWDEVNQDIIPELQGLPYIEIRNTRANNQFLASTLTLPHRIGTAYLSRHKDAMLDGDRFRDVLKRRVKEQGIYRAVFELDPISIVLGCFLSHIQGNMRIPRVVTGQFVAQGAVAMPNGGASHDPISAAGDSVVTKGYFVKEAKEKGKTKFKDITRASEVGLGNVPYVRESYQAEDYLGKFVIDTRLVDAAPNLPDAAKELISLLSQYLVAKFLSEPMMLRSECYFQVKEIKGTDPDLPSKVEDLQQELQQKIQQCQEEGLFNGVTTVEIPIELNEAVEEEKETESAS
ncbi:MAG: type I-U CRISPR-associated RAMP protein Csb1/Cas7u [Halothece sp. Uz-M2-17]|nr:type I-U CRISPR-associated RAMP protein Csb1/Cas7u [Halothece sp. Uz-M2-17]